MLAPVTDGMLTYVQEPLEIGRRGSMGRHLNGKNASSPLREAIAYERGVSEGVQATVLI